MDISCIESSSLKQISSIDSSMALDEPMSSSALTTDMLSLGLLDEDFLDVSEMADILDTFLLIPGGVDLASTF